MSNKAISVYAEAMKRQKAEEGKQPPVQSFTQKTERKERKQVDKKTNKHVNMSTSKQDYDQEFLSKKSFAPASYRLPPEVVAKLRKVYLRANDKYGEVKIYQIVVAALVLFFWDFEKNGKESELYKLLVKGKQENK